MLIMMIHRMAFRVTSPSVTMAPSVWARVTPWRAIGDSGRWLRKNAY